MVLIQSIVIFKKEMSGYILKIITKLYVTHNGDTISFCYKSLITILVVMMREEEVNSDDDMEYTEDAIDNMI